MVSARAIGGVIIPLILPALDIGIIDLVDRPKKEVGITDEQEKGIRNIMNEVNPLKAGADNSVPMPQRFMQARDRIRGLLTPEQQEKFDKMPGPGGGGMGGGLMRRFRQGGGQSGQEEN